jgi:rhodanese-related sulfurtransferase
VAVDSQLVDKLARLQPLASLAPDALRRLAPLCRIERVARNLDPLRLRDWTGKAIFLFKGQLKVDFADGGMMVLVGGTDRALLPLGGGGFLPKAAKAITDVELLYFDEDTLDIVVTWDQIMAPAARRGKVEAPPADWRTMSGIFAVQNLTQGAFAALPAAHIRALFERFQRIKVMRGDVVVREGDAGDYYYLIEQGRCTVLRQVAGSPVELAELAELAAGDAFGEEALVSETARNATVTMKTGGVLLRLAKDDFVELLREPLLRRLDPLEAERKVAAGALWLDVRFPAEYLHDGLPGAINLPLNEIRQAFAMLDKSRAYVAYCQTGRRSSAAAFLLAQRGFDAYLLAGGQKALAAAHERKTS